MQDVPMNLDATGLKAIGQLLDATGLFASVLVGRNPPALGTSGHLLPRAWVRQKGFKEDSTVDPESPLRVVTFEIALTVDRGWADDAEDALAALAESCRAAVTGQNFDLGALPALTRLDSGAFPAFEPNPQTSLVCNGHFSYFPVSS
jgi:hypothetical protein